MTQPSRLAAFIAMAICAGALHAQIVINEPGLTESRIGEVPFAGGAPYGGIAEAQNGYLFAVGGNSSSIYRWRPGDLNFSSFASLDILSIDKGLSVVAEGNTLFVGMRSGHIKRLSATAGVGQLPLLMTVLPVPGEVLDLHQSCAGATTIAATTAGLYEVDLLLGLSTSIYNSSGNSMSSSACSLSGTQIITTDFEGNRLLVTTAAAPWNTSVFYSDGGLTFVQPDGVAVHPITGDIYVASATQNRIERFNAAGVRQPTFATGFDFSADYRATPMTFSSDGDRLYYGNRVGTRWEVRVIDGFLTAQSVQCEITSPLAGSTAGSEILISFDAEDSLANPLTCNFEYSTDSGATYSPCSVVPCAALSNPTPAMPSPVISAAFIWNSYADGVAFAAPTDVDLRLTASNGTTTDTAFSAIIVDNTTRADLTAPVCASEASGSVELVFDGDDVSGAGMSATFEYSTDAGTTWSLCTTSASSAMNNPSSPMPAPAIAARFIWNSYADGVGLAASAPVNIRVSMNGGSGSGFSTRAINVVNTGLFAAIRSPATGSTTAGEVTVSLDADYRETYSMTSAPMLHPIQYSTDGGQTFMDCTIHASSPAPHLALEISDEIVAKPVIWDSLNDSIGLTGPVNVIIRAYATQLANVVESEVEVVVANNGCGPVCGDCDLNGRVDILDALRAALYDVGSVSLSPQAMSNCNVYLPSVYRVSVLDALEIAVFVAGSTLSLNCCP